MLNIWYSISDIDIWYWYLILDIWYSIYAIQYLLLDYATRYLIIISDTWYLTPWYLQSKTLIHATCYLPNVIWKLILTDSFYMILKPAITCKKIVSIRSCSATRSCFWSLWNSTLVKEGTPGPLHGLNWSIFLYRSLDNLKT